jgi:hypothetical protein
MKIKAGDMLKHIDGGHILIVVNPSTVAGPTGYFTAYYCRKYAYTHPQYYQKQCLSYYKKVKI